MLPRYGYFGERVWDRGYENGAKKKIVFDGVRSLNRNGNGCSGGLATDKRMGNFYE